MVLPCDPNTRVACGTPGQNALWGGVTLDAQSALQAWRTRPRRAGRPPDCSLDELWEDLEDRSPTWPEAQEALRRAQHDADEFVRLPPAQRVCARQRSCCGCGRCRACRRCQCDPCARYRTVLAAWGAYHRACRPESLYARTRPLVETAWLSDERPLADGAPGTPAMATTSAETTTRCRSARRRVRNAQLAEALPDVIHRDDNEELWRPTRELLQLQMIDRAEFDAWPARSLAVRSKASRTPAPPRGDLTLRADRSPRLEELRLCRTITKAAIADPAVARAWHHIRKQAAQLRWQRTQRQEEVPAQAEHGGRPHCGDFALSFLGRDMAGAAGLALPATELRGSVDGEYVELDLTAIEPWCREQVLAWAKAGEPKAHRPPQVVMGAAPRRRAPRQ